MTSMSRYPVKDLSYRDSCMDRGWRQRYPLLVTMLVTTGSRRRGMVGGTELRREVFDTINMVAAVATSFD